MDRAFRQSGILFFWILRTFLIITGFFYFYLGLYKSSVELPYEKLAIVEEKLRKGVENKYRILFDNANDAIITRSEYLVTSWTAALWNFLAGNARVNGKETFKPHSSIKFADPWWRDHSWYLDGNLLRDRNREIRKDGSKIFVSLTTSNCWIQIII